MTRARAAVFLIMGLVPVAAGAADTIGAATTHGSGTLTMCRSWIVYNSCSTYTKVVLPDRVAVGDKLKLTFGSNSKKYTFHIASIRREAGGCTVLSNQSDAVGEGERIEIAPCDAAETTAAETK